MFTDQFLAALADAKQIEAAIEADMIHLRKLKGKWVPDKLEDRKWLVACGCPSRFYDEQLDEVMRKVSDFGFWLGYENEEEE